MKIIIEAVNTPALYKEIGTTAILRAEAIKGFTTSNGQIIPPGNGNGDFYLEIPVTITADEMRIPSFEIDSTEDCTPWDSATIGDVPGYRFTLVTSRQKKIPYFPQCKVPVLTGADTSFTWGELRIYNRAFVRRFTQLDRVISEGQVLSWIQDALGSRGYSSENSVGIAASSVDHIDPSFPVHVSNNDPRVPTQDENDALVGTSGSPSSTNKYVTNDDVRLVDVSFYATAGLGTEASPWTGWDAAITWASDTRYNFRRGWYSYATWPAAINALHRVSLIGEGKGQTCLKYTGAANAVNYLSSVLLPTTQFEMEGFSLIGNATALKGILLQEAHHCTLRDISVRGFTEHGFLFKGCVLNDYYNLDCSRQSDEAVNFDPTPMVGIEVTNNGGQVSSVNVFYNPIVEFVPTCFIVTNAWNTTIIGGSMEGLAGDPESPLFGFFIGTGADTTTIIGGDHEGCVTANLRIQGTAKRTVCLNTYWPLGLVDIVDADRTKFIGGLLDDVTIGVAGGIVELDCEITGTLINNSPAGDRYRARVLTAQPVTGSGDASLQIYNGAGGNLWRWRQTAASNDLRMSFESLAGTLTDFLLFDSMTGSASFLNDVSVTNDLTTTTAKVGAAGTILTLILKGTVTINPASINGTTVSSQTFTLTGAAVGDALRLNPPAAGLTAGLLVAQAFVSATNTITIVFYNTTGAPIDEASASWTYALIRS